MAEPIQFPEEIVPNEDQIEQLMQQQEVQQDWYRLNNKIFNSHHLNSSRRLGGMWEPFICVLMCNVD
jgi:hypothetical protein